MFRPSSGEVIRCGQVEAVALRSRAVDSCHHGESVVTVEPAVIAVTHTTACRHFIIHPAPALVPVESSSSESFLS